MRWIMAAAWLQVMLGGLCMTAVPMHAVEEEARVLILNGTDPYLPAYLAIDSAMRALEVVLTAKIDGAETHRDERNVPVTLPLAHALLSQDQFQTL